MSISQEGFKKGFIGKASEKDLYRKRVEIFLRDKLNRILLGRRGEQSDRPGGIWIAPGGGVDPGETHRQAAKRETLEEAGYLGSRYRQISPEVMQYMYTHDPIYKGSRTKSYTGLVKKKDLSLLGADKDQLDELKFFPIDKAIALLREGARDPKWEKAHSFRAGMLEKLKQQLER